MACCRRYVCYLVDTVSSEECSLMLTRGYGCLFGALALAATSCGGRAEAGSADPATGGTSHGGDTSWEFPEELDPGGEHPTPTDERPAPPLWEPPFALGAPGWGMGSDPLCQHHQGATRASGDVWADERGVFTFYDAYSSCAQLEGGHACSGNEGYAVQFNDGTGWRSLYHRNWVSNFGRELTGFPGGDIVVFNNGAPLFVDDEGVAEFRALAGNASPRRMSVAGADVAYAVGSGSPPSYRKELFKYAQGAWTALAPAPAGILDVWSDGETIVAVGEEQAVFVKSQDEDFAEVPGVPAGTYDAVWAFGPNDIWVGSYWDIAHFDGTSWTVVHELDTVEGARVKFWSDGTDLFFAAEGLFVAAEGEFGRVRRNANNSVEVLLSLAGSGISLTGMWGRSSNEVFLSLIDRDFNAFHCGDNFVLWFDGEEFHRF